MCQVLKNTRYPFWVPGEEKENYLGKYQVISRYWKIWSDMPGNCCLGYPLHLQSSSSASFSHCDERFQEYIFQKWLTQSRLITCSIFQEYLILIHLSQVAEAAKWYLVKKGYGDQDSARRGFCVSKIMCKEESHASTLYPYYLEELKSCTSLKL